MLIRHEKVLAHQTCLRLNSGRERAAMKQAYARYVLLAALQTTASEKRSEQARLVTTRLCCIRGMMHATVTNHSHFACACQLPCLALARRHIKFQTLDRFHVLDLKCGAGIDSDNKSDSDKHARFPRTLRDDDVMIMQVYFAGLVGLVHYVLEALQAHLLVYARCVSSPQELRLCS